MMKSYQIQCPKCNNNQNFYRYGKDSMGYQKYQCRCCDHQFAPDHPRAGEGQIGRPRKRSYPACPHCGKSSFIHHDYEHYTNFRCSDKKCYHSFFVVKNTAVAESSMSHLFGKTSFVIGFHLSPHRDSPQAFSLLSQSAQHGTLNALVSDRYSAYNVPTKSVFGVAKHIRVESFRDDISNNLIECFNKQFKAWYKTKQGFSSFQSANNLISMFLFFYNFVRPHSALDGLTPAQVAGLKITKKQRRNYLLIA